MNDDTISRRAAIDRINKQREHLQPGVYPQDKIGDAAYRICAEFIERLPSAQPEPLAKESRTLVKDLVKEPCEDTVSREAAISQIKWWFGLLKQNPDILVDAIKTLPSVTPEIVRCKDCKYCDRGIDEDGNPFLKCLGWVYGGTQEEDFCSHAERRIDGRD